MTTQLAVEPLGVVRVTGADRIDLLHRISTNDLLPLKDSGKLAQTVFTNAKGRIIDWVRILSLPEQLLILTSQGRAKGLVEWIGNYTIVEDVTCTDVSADYGHLVLWGDEALPMTGSAGLAEGTWAGSEEILWWPGLAAYANRFEMLCPAGQLSAHQAGLKTQGALLADDDVLERVRIEAGVPSPRFEFEDEVNPLELRINKDAIHWRKGCYIGQEVIARLDAYDKLARVLMGVQLTGTCEPGMKIWKDDQPVGRITSAHRAGSNTIALGVVNRAYAVEGPVQVGNEGGRLEARLVNRAFWAGTI